MEGTVLYWHWLVLGMLLIAAEIFIPSFTIVWFGIAAIIVGGVLAVDPDLSLSWQVAIWAGLTAALAGLWFLLLRPKMRDKTRAGMAKEAIAGQVGQVIRRPGEHHRGRVRFTTPLLGDDEWEFICSSDVELGDRVSVIELSGNTLLVEKR